MPKTREDEVADFLADYLVEVEEMIAEAVEKILREKYGVLLALIEERAKPGTPGEKGEKGDPGETKESKTVVVEQTVLQPIERRETTVLPVTYPITPGEIKEKLMELEVRDPWFDAEHISGLRRMIRSIASGMVKLGGGGGGTSEFFTVSGTVDGSNTAFTLSKPMTSIVLCLNGQVLRPTTHYTHTPGSASVTMVIAPKTGGTLFGFGQP